jgi:hypothetical protein
MRCDQTPAWKALTAHAAEATGFDLRTAFAQDPSRAETLSQNAPHVFADLSKNRVDAATEVLLQELAQQTGVAAHRDAMFRGEPINTTEDRAVMHWLLRQPEGSLGGDLAGPLAQVHATLKPMLAYAETIRADTQITDVVNMGIGGSDLGPQMAVLALQDFVIPGKRFHFVSNVDGHELAAVLAPLKPETTLFVVASKSFTTLDTMVNARSALAWFKAQGGAGVPLSDEFVEHIRTQIVEPDYAEFVAEVAKARGLTDEAVRALRSLVYPSAKALELGLIDRIENADAYVAELAAALPQQDPRPAQGDGNGAKGVTMTVAELKAKFPELTAEIEQGAVAGAASEMAAQAAKPATFGELKAEFGADSGFIVNALEGGLTLSAARKQWADKVNKERAELSAKITAQDARLKELESLPSRGVENAIPAGGTAGKGSDYLSIVKANQAAGMNQGQAHVAAQKSHPALYTAYCQQVGNALRNENV